MAKEQGPQSKLREWLQEERSVGDLVVAMVINGRIEQFLGAERERLFEAGQEAFSHDYDVSELLFGLAVQVGRMEKFFREEHLREWLKDKGRSGAELGWEIEELTPGQINFWADILFGGGEEEAVSTQIQVKSDNERPTEDELARLRPWLTAWFESRGEQYLIESGDETMYVRQGLVVDELIAGPGMKSENARLNLMAKIKRRPDLQLLSRLAVLGRPFILDREQLTLIAQDLDERGVLVVEEPKVKGKR